MNLFKSPLGGGVATPVRKRSEASDAAWARLDESQADARALRRKRVVTLDPADPACMPFDMLRSQLLQVMRSQGWRSLAITSPGPGCGKSLTSANLAFSFARQRNARVLLVEVDLRRPSLAKLLGIRPPRPVDALLSGAATPEEAFLKVGPRLAAAFADGPVEDPAELLHDAATPEAMSRLAAELDPDLVIYDLPPMLVSDDASVFLNYVDCALLIAAAHESELEEISRSEARMAELTETLGIVLNKCEFSMRDFFRYSYS
jgi:protein-tyrosine kinase